MDTMRAAVFEKTEAFVLKDVPVPQLKADDEVLVEVEAVSICGTDVHITADPPGYAATPGTILGHEFCGRIAAKGEAVRHLNIGDRVVVNPNNYCGVCVYCRKNLPNLCEHIEALGIDYDGAFAKYCVINAKVAYKIAESVPAEVAACVEPLACAVNALNKINVQPGDSAVVIGAGPIGMMIAMLMKASGASKVFLLETVPYRVGFAREKGIATHVLNPLEDNVQEAVLMETGGLGADFVIDVTGSQAVTGIELVRKGGRVVLFGVNAKARAELAQSRITQKEIDVIGTWLANATFPEAVRIVEQEAIDVGCLVTDVLPLDKVHEGIGKLAKGQAVKIVVHP
jgi:threonine dehydrogenase-like Zn-dependent dehydrogenase